MSGQRPLRRGNVNGLCETKSQPSSLFDTNHGEISVVLRIFALPDLGIAGISAHEKAGGLNRQACACEVDCVESQADIASIASDIGGPGGLHPAGDGGAARDQFIAIDFYGFVDHRLKGFFGSRVLGGNRILQSNRQQRSGG